MSDPESNQDPPRPTTSNVADRQPPSSPAKGREPSPKERFRELASPRTVADEHEQEESLWIGGYSPKAMVGMWVVMALVTVAIIAAAVLFEPLTFLIAAGLIVAMWLVGGFAYLWRRLGIHYELTTQRFIHKKGVLTRHTDRIEVIDINDVSYRQGPIERILGVGTIVITSSDQSHPELTMVGIDEVTRIAGLIDDVRRKERRKRSLHLRQM